MIVFCSIEETTIVRNTRHTNSNYQQVDHYNNFLHYIYCNLLMLLDSYLQFTKEISDISFSILQQKFKQFSQQSVNKWLPPYVPKLHQYSLEFDQHQRQEEKMKNVPAFNGKKTFHNNQNLHRRVIALFKGFLVSQYKDIREYLRLTIDIDQLSAVLSKIDILRLKSPEFNLVYYLFTTGRKSIRLFLKLREEIIKTNTFQRNRFLPISTHNQAKYVEKYAYLDTVMLPIQQWREIINLAGFEYDQEFMKVIFDSSRTINAVQIVEYCLWLNREYGLTLSPQKA